MKLIVYSMADGSIALGRICNESGEYTDGILRRLGEGKTEDEALAEIAGKDSPKGCASWAVVDSTDLPSGDESGTFDSTFRDAFAIGDGRVLIDMDKARSIHMGRIRAWRNARLAELDIETMRNIGSPEKLASVESGKQRLRDLPTSLRPQIDAATTPADLLKIQPTGE